MHEQFRQKLRTFSLPGRNAHAKIPEYLHEGIVAYICGGITPGGFFTAVVCNDLRGAFQRADHRSHAAIPAIVQFMSQHAPAACWGSTERMVSWQRERSVRGPLTAADWTII